MSSEEGSGSRSIMEGDESARAKEKDNTYGCIEVFGEFS
jgi:hypothetical protein